MHDLMSAIAHNPRFVSHSRKTSGAMFSEPQSGADGYESDPPPFDFRQYLADRARAVRRELDRREWLRCHAIRLRQAELNSPVNGLYTR